MTTTIQHLNTPGGDLTVVRAPQGTVAMPGLLGAAEAMRFATDHFAKKVATLGKPMGHMHPRPARGVAMQGKFKVDLPAHGHLWIARKFRVPSDMLTHANSHLPRRAWNGRTILDLRIGDVVFIPKFACAPGYYFDPNLAECRKSPCRVGQVWNVETNACEWPRSHRALGAVPGLLGGDDQCSTAGVSAPYDGDSCTSNAGDPGTCNGGICIAAAKTGLTNNSDGQPCNTNGVVGTWQGGICTPGIQNGTCQDPFGNPGKYDVNNVCVTMTGNPGADCISDGGFQGKIDASGACVVCGQFQTYDPNGACIDTPCPPCMDRSAAGQPCITTTAATCQGVFDPNGPGGECCFNNCGTNEHYDMQWHSCYCDTGYVRDATSGDCVVAATPPPVCGAGTHPNSKGDCVPDAPPPHVDPCGKAPNGSQMVSYAGGPCVPPPPTCPTGQSPDDKGNCVAAPPPSTGGSSKSNSGLGIVVGLLAVGTAVGVGLAINKKNKRRAHA